MQHTLKFLTLALALSAAPVALAQTGGSTTGSTGQGMTNQPMMQQGSGAAGSTGAATTGSGTTTNTMDLQADIRQRAGSDQREIELIQTTLLNRFGEMGFAQLGQMRKSGNNYIADVQTVDGRWVTVMIDPATGQVSQQAAASGTSGAPVMGSGTATPGGTARPSGEETQNDTMMNQPGTAPGSSATGNQGTGTTTPSTSQ